MGGLQPRLAAGRLFDSSRSGLRNDSSFVFCSRAEYGESSRAGGLLCLANSLRDGGERGLLCGGDLDLFRFVRAGGCGESRLSRPGMYESIDGGSPLELGLVRVGDALRGEKALSIGGGRLSLESGRCRLRLSLGRSGT